MPLKSRVAVTSALKSRGFAFSTSSEAFVNIASPLMQPQLGTHNQTASSASSLDGHTPGVHPLSYFAGVGATAERPPPTPPPTSIAELQARTFTLLKKRNILPIVDSSIRLVHCAGRKDTLRGGTGSHSSFATSMLRLQQGIVKCLIATPRPRFLSITLTDAEPASLIMEQSLLVNFKSGQADEPDVLLGNQEDILIPITLDLRNLPMESTGIVCGIAGRLVGGTTGSGYDSDTEDLGGTSVGAVEMNYLSTAQTGTVMVAELELERALDALRGHEADTGASAVEPASSAAVEIISTMGKEW